MKHFYPIFFNKICALILLTSFFYFPGCSSVSSSTDANASFQTFTKELFCQEVSSSTISLHYTLQNPSNYGLQDCPVTYGTLSTNTEEACASIENCTSALHAFASSQLSEENQLTFDILDSYLEVAASGTDYILYQEPFSPVTGIHAQLPVLLSEYQFYNMQDVSTYLELLGQTGTYFDSLINFEQSKSKAGLFMPDYQVDSIIQQCRSFLDMGKNNYLYATFTDRLEHLSSASANSISEEEMAEYESQNAQQIQNVIFPAYSHLMEELEALKGTGTNEKGLCFFPDGKGYYEYLVRLNTGISESIPSLQQITLEQIAEDLAAMEKVLYPTDNVHSVSASIPSDSPSVNVNFSLPTGLSPVSINASLPATSLPALISTLSRNHDTILESANPSSMLNDLKTQMNNAFPSIPDVTTSVKYVPSAMEDYLSPAFYMIPAIDNSSENVIYINRGQTVEGLNLYTTLAHEGYPGHLYQTVYFTSKETDPVRSILNFGGYVEGWATYAEMMSYYMSPLTAQDATLFQKNSSVMLALYALADMGIHYDGWSITDTASFFKEYGITDVNAVKSIYELIIGDPSNYLKYYLGYLEFYNLKKEIAAELGTDFSQMDFHKAVLDVGPAPFDIVEKSVRKELLK